jgi:thiamine pyrophosphokinase
VCNGEPPSDELLTREEARADLVVYTDGAAGRVGPGERRMDVIIGDMDSVTGPVRGAQVVDAGPHDVQEDSDSEKAVLYCIASAEERGISGRDQVTTRILGGAGLRMDHTLANVLLCIRYADRADVRLVGDGWELWGATGRTPLGLSTGSIVSLLPMGPGVHIKTHGLRWPLDEIVAQGSRGLSNEVLREDAAIEVTGGPVAVVVRSGGEETG